MSSVVYNIFQNLIMTSVQSVIRRTGPFELYAEFTQSHSPRVKSHNIVHRSQHNQLYCRTGFHLIIKADGVVRGTRDQYNSYSKWLSTACVQRLKLHSRHTRVYLSRRCRCCNQKRPHWSILNCIAKGWFNRNGRSLQENLTTKNMSRLNWQKKASSPSASPPRRGSTRIQHSNATKNAPVESPCRARAGHEPVAAPNNVNKPASFCRVASIHQWSTSCCVGSMRETATEKDKFPGDPSDKR